MPALKLIYAPDPIFRQKAAPVDRVDDEIRQMSSDMFEVLYREQGVGLGANMVGLLKRLIVIDLQEGGVKQPIAMVNPEIVEKSEELQAFEEGSLSYPGISAEITRPKNITVTYLDEQGAAQTLEAEGWLATVIQHEVDYLDGVVFLDYLSPVKRNMLLKKMKKYRKQMGI
ncbi:peptide deformylase [Emcibacter sp.]|uniref:peptide deformylase n=1 Tax=Emcibacter sp. TaxID=1979954 RepID=UPI002AA6CA9C|nr:peptide deformylase [Emcibacter sp.]